MLGELHISLKKIIVIHFHDKRYTKMDGKVIDYSTKSYGNHRLILLWFMDSYNNRLKEEM